MPQLLDLEGANQEYLSGLLGIILKHECDLLNTLIKKVKSSLLSVVQGTNMGNVAAFNQSRSIIDSITKNQVPEA